MDQMIDLCIICIHNQPSKREASIRKQLSL